MVGGPAGDAELGGLVVVRRPHAPSGLGPGAVGAVAVALDGDLLAGGEGESAVGGDVADAIVEDGRGRRFGPEAGALDDDLPAADEGAGDGLDHGAGPRGGGGGQEEEREQSGHGEDAAGAPAASSRVGRGAPGTTNGVVDPTIRRGRDRAGSIHGPPGPRGRRCATHPGHVRKCARFLA